MAELHTSRKEMGKNKILVNIQLIEVYLAATVFISVSGGCSWHLLDFIYHFVHSQQLRWPGFFPWRGDSNFCFEGSEASVVLDLLSYHVFPVNLVLEVLRGIPVSATGSKYNSILG